MSITGRVRYWRQGAIGSSSPPWSIDPSAPPTKENGEDGRHQEDRKQRGPDNDQLLWLDYCDSMVIGNADSLEARPEDGPANEGHKARQGNRASYCADYGGCDSGNDLCHRFLRRGLAWILSLRLLLSFRPGDRPLTALVIGWRPFSNLREARRRTPRG
jgi:hypothetical protein